MKTNNTLITVFFMFFVSTPMSLAAGGNRFVCQEHALPITLAAGEDTQYRIVGSLCAGGTFENKMVQVLLSGSTYKHMYWDLPYRYQHYSYVRAAVKAGYAVFNFDRIGIGASDHPPGKEITVDANAFVTHQIVQALRAGEIGGVPFKHVVLLGHSLGGTIAVAAAAQYPNDFNGVVLAGWAHKLIMPENFPIHLANLDPRFEHLNLDNDYFTTVPGVRGKLFYYQPTAAQAVIDLDEATKETLTTGEINTSPTILNSTVSRLIEVPVLIINGEFDIFYDVASIAEDEQDLFSPKACLKVSIVPRSGHDINLQRNAHAAFARMLRWTDRHVGVDGAMVGVCDQLE